jgi:hypothetical protein
VLTSVADVDAYLADLDEHLRAGLTYVCEGVTQTCGGGASFGGVAVNPPAS